MRAFVDRIESGIATLLLGEDESGHAQFPVRFLPPGTREGMVLQLTASIEEQATQQTHREVQERIDRLQRER